jgi:hypothetical protein
MDIAFNHSKDGIPLTFVQMARIRGRNDFRQYSDYGFNRNRHFQGGGQFYSNRKPPKWKAFIIVMIIVIFVSLFLSWRSLDTRLQKYISLTRTVEVAELSIQKSREGEDQLLISLTLIDANGYYKRDTKPYLINGDKMLLQYEYILVPPWLGPSGLHSGYIFISLDAQNKNGVIVYSRHLNEAENDNSITARMYAFVVSSKYGSITLMPSRSVYKLCITQTGQLKEC